MATAFSLKIATAHRLVYELTGDGTSTVAKLATATLVADAVTGPLKTLLQTTCADQAAARLKFLYGNPARLRLQLRTRANDVTAEKNQPAADINVSATPGLPEIETELSETTGQVAILEIEYVNSLVS